ncbi:MAG: hypothetical protein QOI77_120 [Blastocatellia bacterium]|nr:hypothetical protein [Blastocatellia bacterium]
MKPALIPRQLTLFMFATVAMLAFVTARGVAAQPLPAPQVVFGGTEDYEAQGKQWTKYRLALLNRSNYANELFAPAPDLAPCGDNKNSARTWVDIYNRQSRQQIYRFCALQGAKDLGYLWFAIEKGTPPPESVYLTITDRRANTRATSNVLAIPTAGMSAGASPNAAPTPPDISGRPDLIVKEILFDPSPSKIRVRVVNQGTGASSSCYLALASVAGDDPSLPTKQRVWSIPIPALDPGKGFSNAIDVAPLAQTNGQWKATVDRSNTVAESNENNNTLTYPGGNPGPVPPNFRRADLVIEHFALTNPSNGQVTVAVVNKGGGNSAACTLRLIVWKPGKFEQEEAKTVFVKVQALHPGQSVMVIAAAGVPIINTKYSLYIDIGEDVAEADENNNRAEGEAGNFKP